MTTGAEKWKQRDEGQQVPLRRTETPLSREDLKSIVAFGTQGHELLPRRRNTGTPIVTGAAATMNEIQGVEIRALATKEDHSDRSYRDSKYKSPRRSSSSTGRDHSRDHSKTSTRSSSSRSHDSARDSSRESTSDHSRESTSDHSRESTSDHSRRDRESRSNKPTEKSSHKPEPRPKSPKRKIP